MDNFFGLFFWIIFFSIFWTLFWSNYWTIFWTIYGGGGGKPLVLRNGWDAVYQYSRRGGRQTVVTEGGVEDELLERRDGWEVVLLVNATE